MADDSQNIIRKLESVDSLLDVMIQVEDYLDSLDLYVFANWIEGELVKGPYVERYWVKFSLKYPCKKMPDPQGGLRLLKYGSKVAYEKSMEEVPVEVTSSEDIDPKTQKPKMKKKPIWLVHFKIPRRFIEELNIEGLDLYGEDSDDMNQVLNAETELEQPVEETPVEEAPVEETGGELEI